MNDLVQKAKSVATKAHEGQTRWGGKIPYIVHPEAIAHSFRDPKLQAVSWLHDVIEDTEVTEEDLRKEFPEDVVDAVVALSRQPQEEYLTFVLRSKENALARMVKIADIQHNLSDRLKKGSMRDKYLMAIHILEEPEEEYAIVARHAGTVIEDGDEAEWIFLNDCLEPVSRPEEFDASLAKRIQTEALLNGSSFGYKFDVVYLVRL